MIFQPILNPWLIGIIGFILVAFTLYSAWGHRKTKPVMWAWVRRTVIVLLLPVLAFRPGVGAMEEIDVYTNQFDIYFVVDTTTSMAAEDMEGEAVTTRLDQVKKDIDALVQKYSGARYSLIGFDSQASIRAPLTHDASAVMSAVNVLNTEVSKYSTGTPLNSASFLLAQTLRENAILKPERARIVFFFSDGEETSDQPVTTTQVPDETGFVFEGTPDTYTWAEEYMTTGYVYGYGSSEGGKMKRNDGYLITNKDNPYVVDPITGEDAISKADSATLQKIADELNVSYQHRVIDEDLEYAEVDAAKLDPAAVTSMRVVADFTWMLALPILILTTVEMMLMFITFRKVTRQQEVLTNG